MYGKIINGELVKAPEKMLQYEYKEMHICAINPTKENYIQAGYKVVECEQRLEGEGEGYEAVYEESEDKIIVKL